MSDKPLCTRCGKHPRFQHKDRMFELCALCGWEAIRMMLKIPNDASKTPEQQLTEAIDYTPYEEWAK